MLEQPDGPPGRPTVREYTTEVAALYDVCDRLSEVVHAVLLAGKLKPSQPHPRLRPLTEVERARARRDTLAHLDRVDEVMAAQERWRLTRGGKVDDASS